ncbi:glycosyltransferase involved in cell wall biosynthesis [Mariniflexile fucanivorans]|uniref:Glycosyltransferase involved in cell wall biosynthesis n=1 Tax=Mariniflexile fucanivorans TaxID=264023 RepID=A0A4R1RG86_9FLAO|nr:glycosyltransferase family 1 protein [Mariniflexile fucanivorans]TCL65018.1 glycosyltransferase involved in cell wall biosynthesis [Mariniflexile fucanivorans]
MNKESKNIKPIRILQVLTIMNRGGAETMIMNYYRAMDRTKVQFDFLLHRPDQGAFDKEILSLGGKIYRMPAISPKNYFLYKKQLNLFFNTHKEYKIIHSHLNALSSIILKIAKKNDVPIRIAHSHLAVEPFIIKKLLKKNTDIVATIKDTLQSLVKYRVNKNATHYFACGLKAGEWLFGKENLKKVTVINNAINASLFTYSSSKTEESKSFLQLDGKKVIGHVGRFNEQKNHFFLIKIFKEIYELDKNCHLVLIGDGNLMPLIEKEAKKLNINKNVHFLGLQENIPFLIQSFDLFLFPSLYEGLPVTLIEAQASGIPIVTSNTVTKEAKITNLITFLDLNNSEKKWADAVLQNLKNSKTDTYKSIVKNNYDIFENAKKLQTFYLNNY